MDTQESSNKRISKSRLWTARIVSGIVIIFMLFDGIMKLIAPPSVVEATVTLGYAKHDIPVIGVLALICTALYAIPGTSVLGAVLLTGYYGGVVATHFRLDHPLFTHTLFSVYLAILAWAALWLTNEKLRQLFRLPHKKTI